MTRRDCLFIGIAVVAVSILANCGRRKNAGPGESTSAEPPWQVLANANPGSAPVRIEDPSGSHCIDASTESVTIHVRRLFVQKYSGLFTEDKKAGVLVSSRLSGAGIGQSIDVTIPSVNTVSISDASKGHISVPLEYEIAQYFKLKQDKGTYYGLNLAISLAKTRGKSSFGEVLDLAGKALGQVKIPPIPYIDIASQFLKFANDAIDSNVKDNTGAVPFANIALAFNDRAEPNLEKCKAMGKERTGGFGVLLSTGDPGNLLPVHDTEKQYCLSYTAGTAYELTAAKRKPDGTCPPQNEFKAITNDNVFFLLSAQSGVPHAMGTDESNRRCAFYGLPASACGGGKKEASPSGPR